MKLNRIKTILLILILILTFNLVACGSSIEGANQEIIRISNGQPIQHPENIAMQAFKDYIEDKLGDRYQVVIYPNELLGSSKNALELCQTGALEFVIASSSNMETFDDIFTILSMPYLFNSVESYYETMDNPQIAKTFSDSTADQGLMTVGWYDAGSRNFYSNRAIRNIDDIKGMKIRVQPSPTNIAMMQAFDAGAVPMAFSEVYTAIQNGTIDGAENNELALTTVKHGEVVDYYSYTMHQMQPDFLITNFDFYNGLSQEEKEVFDEAIRISEEVEREEWRKQVDEARKIAENEMGVEFVESDIGSFREKVKPLHDRMISENDAIKTLYENIEAINMKNQGEKNED